MSAKIYNIKITPTPSHDLFAIAGDLVIKLQAPYSDTDVTIKVNPNIVEYKDKISDNLRQLSVSKDTDETKTLMFDFQKNNIHNLRMADKNYEIKLMHIGEVVEQGQSFKTFEFMVTEL